ncbi:uncharacterized protein LOC126773851 [Nymphalis io]|uniref:uncharacterized protein LOC126773851 n=1 Tax=Inachis io TaxID=171585 RepID=UPI002169C3EE|nr:uncharacterized protein LOC126773851 [Nymphalis io]
MAGRLIVVIFLTAPFIYCHKLISILSDFNNDKDVEFFKTTLPWIVDNVGSDINLKFHFKDSGINSGPRQCVLFQLSRNIYLQVDYLSCEAKGNAHKECIKHLPINIPRLHNCLRSSVKRIVKNAEREFRKFKVDATPVIILPRRRIINDKTPQNIIKCICDLYPRQYTMRPIGCIKTSPLPGKNQEDEKTNETSSPKSEASPKEEKQNDELSTPESDANLKEEKQQDEQSTTESGANPREEKQNDELSTPESEANPKEEEQKDENFTPESEANLKEEKKTVKESSLEGEPNLNEEK